MKAIIPKTELAGIFNAWAAALTTPKVRLFTDDISITDTTAYADLHAPAGDWYTPADAVFGRAYEDDAGNLHVEVQSVQFDYTGSHAAETVRGYCITTGTSPIVMHAVGKLDNPVQMANTLDSALVEPALTIPPITAGA